MSTTRWAITTALALVGLAAAARSLVWALDPLLPWLVVTLVVAAVCGVLVRRR